MSEAPYPLTIPIDGHDWTLDEMRSYADALRAQHTPANQDGNPYDRCEHCHYTCHPCDTHELASLVLALVAALQAN